MDKKYDNDSRRSCERIVNRLRLSFDSVEEFKEEYTRNICREGVFVQTDNPLPVMEAVEVTLGLPPPQPAVTLKAKVVHIITSQQADKHGTTAGMGLHFHNLDEETKYILESYIQQEIKKSPGIIEKERREHRRKKARIGVKFASEGALRKKFSKDISRGGILIETSKPLPMGTETAVTLIHPVSGEQIALEARVVRHLKNKDGNIQAMGLHFTEFKKRKHEIERFVNSISVYEWIPEEETEDDG